MSDVTVNKCEFYNECDKKVPYYSDIACLNDFSEICMYKQLKRLQAENERLKEEIKKEKEIYKENVHYLACMTSQRNKLKLELEEISEILKGNKDGDIDEMIDKISEVLDERN